MKSLVNLVNYVQVSCVLNGGIILIYHIERVNPFDCIARTLFSYQIVGSNFRALKCTGSIMKAM